MHPCVCLSTPAQVDEPVTKPIGLVHTMSAPQHHSHATSKSVASPLLSSIGNSVIISTFSSYGSSTRPVGGAHADVGWHSSGHNNRMKTQWSSCAMSHGRCRFLHSKLIWCWDPQAAVTGSQPGLARGSSLPSSPALSPPPTAMRSLSSLGPSSIVAYSLVSTGVVVSHSAVGHEWGAAGRGTWHVACHRAATHGSNIKKGTLHRADRRAP